MVEVTLPHIYVLYLTYDRTYRRRRSNRSAGKARLARTAGFALAAPGRSTLPQWRANSRIRRENGNRRSRSSYQPELLNL